MEEGCWNDQGSSNFGQEAFAAFPGLQARGQVQHPPHADDFPWIMFLLVLS